MSDYSQSDLGFIRALARELFVHNHKEYENILFAIQDAESFIQLFNSKFDAEDTHAQVEANAKSRR